MDSQNGCVRRFVKMEIRRFSSFHVMAILCSMHGMFLIIPNHQVLKKNMYTSLEIALEGDCYGHVKVMKNRFNTFQSGDL